MSERWVDACERSQCVLPVWCQHQKFGGDMCTSYQLAQLHLLLTSMHITPGMPCLSEQLLQQLDNTSLFMNSNLC